MQLHDRLSVAVNVAKRFVRLGYIPNGWQRDLGDGAPKGRPVQKLTPGYNQVQYPRGYFTDGQDAYQDEWVMKPEEPLRPSELDRKIEEAVEWLGNNGYQVAGNSDTGFTLDGSPADTGKLIRLFVNKDRKI